MTKDFEVLQNIETMQSLITNDNLGDLLSQCINERHKITNPINLLIADTNLSVIRGFAARADSGNRYFRNIQNPSHQLTDDEVIQLISLERSLHEICFGFERLEEISHSSHGNSTPIRFFINSIYNYLSSMFLIDKDKPSHKGLEAGGSIILVLHPLGLQNLLIPIYSIFNKELVKGFSLGDLVLKIRHSFIVHGKFSPNSIEYVVQQTNLRNPKQQILTTTLLWDVFYQLLLLRLQILSIFFNLEINFDQLMSNYLSKVSS